MLHIVLDRLEFYGPVEYRRFLQASLHTRADEGEKKYGTRLMTHNGRNAGIDAFEEAQDCVMYLQQAVLEGNEKYALPLQTALYLAMTLSGVLVDELKEGRKDQ